MPLDGVKTKTPRHTWQAFTTWRPARHSAVRDSPWIFKADCETFSIWPIQRLHAVVAVDRVAEGHRDVAMDRWNTFGLHKLQSWKWAMVFGIKEELSNTEKNGQPTQIIARNPLMQKLLQCELPRSKYSNFVQVGLVLAWPVTTGHAFWYNQLANTEFWVPRGF